MRNYYYIIFLIVFNLLPVYSNIFNSNLIESDGMYEDSVSYIEKISCGNYSIEVRLVTQNTQNGIKSISLRNLSSYNYKLQVDPEFKEGDKNAKFELIIIDNLKKGRASITISTTNENTFTRIFSYEPDNAITSEKKVDFGYIPLNKKYCSKIHIINPLENPIKVKSVFFKNNSSELSVSGATFPFSINPGDSAGLEICITLKKSETENFLDMAVAELECFTVDLLEVTANLGKAELWISDANWGKVTVNTEVPKNVNIFNNGSVDATINSISWKDKIHFTRIENLNLPLTIKPLETHEFKVYYKPDKENVKDIDTAFFEANTNESKLFSVWNGSGEANEVKETKQIKSIIDYKVFPHPVKDTFTLEISLKENANIKISFINILVHKIFSLPELFYTEGEHKLGFGLEEFNLPPGIYFLIIESNKSKQAIPVILEK